MPSSLSYQDVMNAKGDDDVSTRLFELANASAVTFATAAGSKVSIEQDPSNTTTGGCVWETAYLLAQWIELQLERGSEAWCKRWKAHTRGAGPAVLSAAALSAVVARWSSVKCSDRQTFSAWQTCVAWPTSATMSFEAS